jgi:hypothetical protein
VCSAHETTSRRSVSSRAVALFIVALVTWANAVGCDGASRRDVEVVVAAAQRFRAADLPSTPSAVDALKRTPCTTTEACSARDTCVSAGETIARALTLKDEVARGLAAVESGALSKDSPEAKDLTRKLDETETLLKTGREALPACDEQVQALKRKYRI